MSYDLQVFTHRVPEHKEIEAIAAAVSGELTGFRSSGFTLERRGAKTPGLPVTVDGPFRCERDDLPEDVAERGVGLGWVFQLSAPYGDDRAIQLATAFARALAEKGDGVVYDQQDGSVPFPRGSKRRYKAEPATFIDVVDLHWFWRREDMTDALAPSVFDLIARHLPEASPRRFGEFEPLQGRLSEVGRSGFVAAWKATKMMLFWHGEPPMFTGSMYGLGETVIGAAHLPPHSIGSVTITLDSRAFSDTRWAQEVFELFRQICFTTAPFFAHADLDRNVRLSGRRVSFGPEAETSPGLNVRHIFMGLPVTPVSLAWFGPRYARLVERLLPSGATERHDGGALVRTATAPFADADEGWHAPEDLRVQVTGGPMSWDRVRAKSLPDGL